MKPTADANKSVGVVNNRHIMPERWRDIVFIVVSII